MTLMMQEIFQQPAALERTLRREKERVRRAIQSMTKKPIRLIVLVARGTSDNAALFARYLLEINTGIPVSLAAPSVHTLYGSRLRLEDALVIGISQSGEGADINRVLHSCRKSGARVVAITNERNSGITRIAHESFFTRAGRERSVAATKTYTSQLMLVYMLMEALRGGTFDALLRIPEYAESALGLHPRVEDLVGRYRFMDHCVVVGRGLNYASAFELAIKLMETCYVLADRFSSADLLHGPIAVVQSSFPVFLFAPPGKTFKDLRALARKLDTLRADTLIISSEKSILRHAQCPIEIPVPVPDLYSPIPYIIPGQIFAARLAECKGLNPDHPRGLSKITHTI